MNHQSKLKQQQETATLSTSSQLYNLNSSLINNGNNNNNTCGDISPTTIPKGQLTPTTNARLHQHLMHYACGTNYAR